MGFFFLASLSQKPFSSPALEQMKHSSLMCAVEAVCQL